jgi:hypothetical protein
VLEKAITGMNDIKEKKTVEWTNGHSPVHAAIGIPLTRVED